ncbi:oxidoreductase, FAD-binding, putative [Talaromyces stipitatus ATCC 10500]|uniref:Oxidoreductase, FAD-binding, putative n=1 Tax=Talaromyces stipitatus (strain ATCC 10500 / CBS 375.48 / QM 6759 / NRRL 1006) TaxID=441959 RepID=B8LTK3_TALSN|nr:oxidoreductase, FAD-binding, putative [Talaromyces stipitatus ATCC 10500]EED23081.1 oxidoreductase, FAD-binding, putative [Talaromyces stipitatus ATCC 10500]
MPAMMGSCALPWNQGEIALQRILHVPPTENPTSTFLSQYGQSMVSRAPLIGLGALDANSRPWSTVWGGETGFSSVIDSDIVGMRALVDRVHDPVVQSLFGHSEETGSIRVDGQGKMISGVTIDLENRKRVKLYGKVIMGTLEDPEGEDEGGRGLVGKRGHAQLVVKIEESLGNCPKYLHKKHIIPALPQPKLISTSPKLPPQAIELINKADCFFISTYHQNTDMDTNYRGGPSGFVRIISNQPEGAVLVYPEYSGNRLYQSLGNLMMNHQAGLVIPDFETGDAVYMTVTTEILIDDEADEVLERSSLAVKMTVVEARYVENALGFRGIPVDKSPYTPPVRYLRSEKEQTLSTTTANEGQTSVHLISRKILSPSIARFRFKLSNTGGTIPAYKPGQYAVFSFKDELDIGYSHMRDDDPLSLNDDYIRTFTVSSFPGAKTLPEDEFEITVRKNRSVTSHLFRWNPRTQLKVPMLGFGGSFKIDTSSIGKDEFVPFIAGGIGITPLVGQLPGVDISRLRLLWSISANDIGVVKDVFRQFPELPESSTLFITQVDKVKDEDFLRSLEDIEAAGATIECRRMSATDLKDIPAGTFYLCSGHALKTLVLDWLKGKNVIFEDFTY